MKSKLVLAVACALASALPVFGGTINFDDPSLANNEVGNFYQGVTFSPGSVVTTTTSPGFPAHSGNQLLAIQDPSITVTFATSQSDVSFFYNSFLSLTISAFQNGNATPLVTVVEPSNSPGGGSFPATSTFVDLNTSGIDFVTFSDGVGGSFSTIDDLSAPGITGASVAAPDAVSTLGLLGLAGFGLVAFRRKMVTQ